MVQWLSMVKFYWYICISYILDILDILELNRACTSTAIHRTLYYGGIPPEFLHTCTCTVYILYLYETTCMLKTGGRKEGAPEAENAENGVLSALRVLLPTFIRKMVYRVFR